MYKVKNPILIRIFNRPDKIRKLMKVIKKVKPTELYIVADGSGNKKDDYLIKKTRQIATNINWKCSVKKKFFEKNLGGPLAGYKGIRWFFNSVDKGIILEDDNIPNISFFKFCDELLEYYKNDLRIGMITGNNFQNGKFRGEGSYYFSKYCHIWGWASWKRSIINWELVPKKFLKTKKLIFHNKLYDEDYEQNFWEKNLYNLCKSKKIHWDSSLFFHFMKKNFLTVTPNVNLVSNIGFGKDASNTLLEKDKFSKMKVYSLGKIKHPKKIERDINADRWIFDYNYGGKNLYFPYNWIVLSRRVLGFTYRKIKKFF